MEQRTFKSISGREYREKLTSIIDLMSIISYYDPDDLEKINAVNSFALEHLEVKVKDVWISVKKKGNDALTPASLESDVAELYDITNWYLNNVIQPVFQQSIESMKKRSTLMEKKE